MKAKRMMMLFLICIVLMAVCACGNGSEQITKAKMNVRESVENMPGAKDGLTEMTVDLLSDLTGLDMGKYADVLYFECDDGMGAACLIALEGKDNAAAEEAEQGLNAYLEQRKTETRNYLPDQYALLEKAGVQRKGNTVLLCVGENADKITAGILDGI